MLRSDGRRANQLRPIEMQRGYTELAHGSVLMTMGKTRVLCTASLESGVPEWRESQNSGWLTAEYDMLPASTGRRRARSRNRVDGRSQEIQRLIGRSLRAVTDLEMIAELQITVDCDVLQADGGTRTAAICGGYVALHDAFSRMVAGGKIPAHPITDACAAISVGVVDALAHLDLQRFALDPGPALSWRGVLGALPFAIWFYLAIEQLPLAAEEAHDPQRDMPRGILLGLLTLVACAFLTLVLNTGVAPGAAVLGTSDEPLFEGVDWEGDPLSRVRTYSCSPSGPECDFPLVEITFRSRPVGTSEGADTVFEVQEEVRLRNA